MKIVITSGDTNGIGLETLFKGFPAVDPNSNDFALCINTETLVEYAKKANLNILGWARKEIGIPIVAIGGINNLNYKKLIRAGAKYIAISSYIWDNPKLKPELAIRKFK